MPLIHTCYRITDVDRSIAFYKALGFEEVGRIPIGEEAINIFMNQPGDGDMPRLELTYNFGVDSYEIGTGTNLDLYSLAQAEERSSDHIFLTQRRRDGTHHALTRIGIYQVVKFAFRRAQIRKHVYPHLLRHSWMTEMLRCGMNPIQLSLIAGASTEVISAHYTHLNKDDAYDAMMRAIMAQTA